MGNGFAEEQSGVVDKDIQAACFRPGKVHRRNPFGFTRDIKVPGNAADFRCNFSRVGDISNDYFCTSVCQRTGGRCTNAPRRTRYEGDPPCKVSTNCFTFQKRL